MSHVAPTQVDPATRQCPRCRRDCTDCPPQAKYCVNCGKRLPGPFTILARRALLALYSLRQPPLLQFGPPIGKFYVYRGPADRSLILTGYGNALFHLGRTYEHRPPPTRNLPEALRCYLKSARLGNEQATQRLQALPPPAETHV